MSKRELLASAFCLAMSSFQLYTGIFGSLEPIMQRLLFFGLSMPVIFLSISREEKVGYKLQWLFLGFIAAYLGYFFFRYDYLSAERYAYISQLDPHEIILGTMMVVVVLEACRRSVGWPLSLVAVASLLYGLGGYIFPGLLYHRGYGWAMIIDNEAFTTDGVIGVALAVTASYVVLFVIFGVFLTYAGFGEFLLNFCKATVGKLRGGSGKLAVLATGLMGMINGSATANALAVGSFACPVMIKSGFSKEVSGATVAVGGCGGQLMPPVMGAQAFLMSQITGIPYINIAFFSFFPAVFYYLGIWLGVDALAARSGIGGLRDEDDSSSRAIWSEVIKRTHLIIPVILLVFLLLKGYTLTFAASYSVLAVIPISYFRRETRLTPKRIILALVESGKLSVLVVAAACAAGVIIGMVTLTGLGERFSLGMIALSGNNLLLALIFVAFASIILGMGLPTIPVYMIQVSLIIPALIKMGLTIPAAHLFAIYFACLSMITPPVAVNAYAMAGMVGADAFRVGWIAFGLGIVGYITPFVFVYYPGILLIGTWYNALADLIRMLLITIGLSMAIWGYWKTEVKTWERIMNAVAVLMLFPSLLWLNLLSIAMLTFLLYQQHYRHRITVVDGERGIL